MVSDLGSESTMDEIISVIDTCMDDLQQFEAQIKDKNIIAYVGSTRSGKSTLLNCILGKDLKVIEIYGQYKIEMLNDADSNISAIAHGSVSMTKTPYVHLNYIDFPGFLDNRGEAQEIRNAMYMMQLKHSVTCKIVFVSDVNDLLNDNIANFLNAFKGLTNLVASNFDTSFVIVFTKVPVNLSHSDIIELLNYKILNQQGLRIESRVRNLVKHLVNHPKVIAFFRLPNEKCYIVDDLLEGYKESLDQITPLDTSTIQIKLSLSDLAQHTIYCWMQQFIHKIDFALLIKFNANLDNYFKIEKYVYASLNTELISVSSEIIKFSGKLVVEERKQFNKAVDIFKSLQTLSTLDKRDSFYKKMNFCVKFEEVHALNSQLTAQLSKKYEQVLNKLQKDINNLKSKIIEEQKVRKQMNLNFELENSIGTAAGIGLGILGGIGLRTAASSLIPTVASVVAIPLGIVVAGCSIGHGVHKIVICKIEYDKRIKERKLQKRPIAIENDTLQ